MNGYTDILAKQTFPSNNCYFTTRGAAITRRKHPKYKRPQTQGAMSSSKQIIVLRLTEHHALLKQTALFKNKYDSFTNRDRVPHEYNRVNRAALQRSLKISDTSRRGTQLVLLHTVKLYSAALLHKVPVSPSVKRCPLV